MVLDSLGKSLRGVLQKIARGSTVDEALLNEVVRDIQRALLQADVNVQLALSLTERVRCRAKEEKPPAGRACGTSSSASSTRRSAGSSARTSRSTSVPGRC